MPDTDYYLENVSQAVKEEFIELSKRKDLRLLDLNDTLAISNKWEYFYDYGHPNKKGWSLIQDYMMRNEYENK